MKGKKIVAALCAAAVVFGSVGGLPTVDCARLLSGSLVAYAEGEPIYTFSTANDCCDLCDKDPAVANKVDKITKIEAIVESEEVTWALVQCGYWVGETAHTFSQAITTEIGTNKIVAEGSASGNQYSLAQVMHHGAGKLLWAKVYFNDNTSVEIGSKTNVTNVSLDKSTTQTILTGGKVEFNASITPTTATDKTVKWSVSGDNANAVKLYSDEYCTEEVGTDATNTLKVYANGISAGTATVTATSTDDSTKSASCDVTVNDPSFTVTIPANVTLYSDKTGTAEIKAENVALHDGERVVVTLDSAGNTAKNESTFNAKNAKGDSTAHYTIGTGDSSTGIRVGDPVARFAENGTQKLTFSAASGETYAGAHTEKLTFKVEVETLQ